MGLGVKFTAGSRRLAAFAAWALRHERAVALGLLSCYAGLAFTSTLRKSPTYDEPLYLAAGYSYVTRHDFRLQPENGVLPQTVAGLALLGTGARLPGPDAPAWRAGRQWEVARAFLYGGGNDPDALVTRGRIVMCLAAVLFAFTVYRAVRRLYGPGPALTALALVGFSPTLLAHGRLVTSDMAAAFFLFLVLVCFQWTLERVTPARAAASGLALGGALAAKFSGLLALPMLAVCAGGFLALGRPWVWHGAGRGGKSRNFRHRLLGVTALLLWMGLAAWGVIWALYDFRYSAFAGPGRFAEGASARAVISKMSPGLARSGLSFAARFRLLPEAYLYGCWHVLQFERGRMAFMNGMWSRKGWRSFFPYCFGAKTSAAALLLLLAVLAFVYAQQRGRAAPDLRSSQTAARDALWRSLPFWSVFAVYGVAALSSSMNIGHRHLLPIYAPVFVLAAVGAVRMFEAGGGWRILAAILLCLHVGVGVRAWPDYLAYFNLFSGGKAAGYRHLVDSSLDWGQDLPGLKRWLEKHAEEIAGRPVYLAYFGTADPHYYGIRAENLLDFESPGRKFRALLPGVYCLSATYLQGLYVFGAAGPWTAAKEKMWREFRKPVRALLEAADAGARARILASHPKAFWKRAFTMYRILRYARLSAWLRARRPQAEIGGSILIWRLGAEDLRQALDAPLAAETGPA